MPAVTEARGISTGAKGLPLLKIDTCSDTENTGPPEVSHGSSINLSVCIQDVPPSPTQHAEFTLALTPRSWRRRFRCRKRPVVDIHACFDIDDTSGTVTVVEEGEASVSEVGENCTRYERHSIDLLGFGGELEGASLDSENEEFALLHSPSRCHSHQSRLALINLCRRRYKI